MRKQKNDVVRTAVVMQLSKTLHTALMASEDFHFSDLQSAALKVRECSSEIEASRQLA